MAIERFDIESLAKMDGGRLAVTLRQLMEKARLDCEDRPALESPRKVSVTFQLRPIAAETGELDSVNVTMEFDVALPKRKSRVYNMRSARGGLLFNDVSPEDIRQRTLDMAPRPEPSDEFEEIDTPAQARAEGASDAS